MAKQVKKTPVKKAAPAKKSKGLASRGTKTALKFKKGTANGASKKGPKKGPKEVYRERRIKQRN